MQVDAKRGKKSRTLFEAVEYFRDYTLVACRPVTDRLHQVRVHLRHARLPVVGDQLYGGKPLLLSNLKPGYRLKPDRAERPLISTVALHAAALAFVHPETGEQLQITAEWPKDLLVAVKYLRRLAAANEPNRAEPAIMPPAM
jgi:23S rRNA pseudouridine955/2504/2580 synthase